MPAKVLFLTLRVFSLTGGIEKVNRIAGHVIHNMEDFKLAVYSLHDAGKDGNDKYFPKKIFKCFGSAVITFVLKSILKGIRCRIVILSHINLLPVGYIIKKISPTTKVLVFAHGIEIWKPLSKRKQKMLRQCDLVIAVSEFTKNVVVKNQAFEYSKCIVLNNCLDPFLPMPGNLNKKNEISKRYHITPSDFVLLTLTRLSYKEKYKGYEKVMKSMADLSENSSNIKYLIVGKYQDEERQRLQHIIDEYNLKDKVAFTGFVNDKDLADYYSLANLYVMPSKKEGFGIVFIEAMYYGIPVIGGNKDGSVDALANGKLGLLVDPDDQDCISNAIKQVMCNEAKYRPDAGLLAEKFSSKAYSENLKSILISCLN